MKRAALCAVLAEVLQELIKGLVRYVAVKQIGKTFPLEVTGFGNAEMTGKRLHPPFGPEDFPPHLG